MNNNLNLDVNSKYVGKQIKYKKGNREYNVIITKRYNDDFFEGHTKSGKKSFLVRKSYVVSQLSNIL